MGPAGCSVTTTRQVAHLLQSAGVVTRTLQLQPPVGVAKQVESLGSELRVAEHAPIVKPGSHASAPKTET
jgi:hypothetical protein